MVIGSGSSALHPRVGYNRLVLISGLKNHSKLVESILLNRRLKQLISTEQVDVQYNWSAPKRTHDLFLAYFLPPVDREEVKRIYAVWMATLVTHPDPADLAYTAMLYRFDFTDTLVAARMISGVRPRRFIPTTDPDIVGVAFTVDGVQEGPGILTIAQNLWDNTRKLKQQGVS